MKKILSIVALCLIALLAGTIILFAFINKSYNPNLSNPDYIEVYVNYSGSNNVESYYKNDEFSDRQAIYNKVMELYNNSFNQNIMSGIFQGTIFSKTNITRPGTSKDSALSGGIFIAFNYNDEQTLKLNGENYVYTSGSYTEKDIKYKTLYVEVKNSDAMTDIKIYVQPTNTTTLRYCYNVKASQSALYNYIQENFN